MKNDLLLETILFDMDGVLVDSMALHRESWQEILGRFGIRLADEFVYRHEGAMGLEVIAGIFQQHRVAFEPDLLEGIYQLQNRLFQERYLDRVRLYPQTLPLLARCRDRGLQLGLVTSSRLNLVERIWHEEQLRCFETVVTADRVERFKPNPDPYLQALNDLDRQAGECLVVENAPAGIQAAKAAGLKCFAVASTLSPEHLQEADRIFPDLSALAVYLMEE
ncbi:MAG: HAD family phosphatase [Deltaproteobacteria bacterium]|nr:HAD family phosphatase [Deltaproteobacteria bacterium]